MNIVNNRLKLGLGNFAHILEWGDIQNPITITFTKDCCKEDSITLNYTKELSYELDFENLQVTQDSLKVQFIDMLEFYNTVNAKDFVRLVVENLDTGVEESISLSGLSATNEVQFSAELQGIMSTVNSQIESKFGSGNSILYLNNKLYTILPTPNITSYIEFYDSYGEILMKYSFTPLTSGREGIYFTQDNLYLDSSLLGLDKFEDGVWKVDLDYKYENYDSVFNITDSIFVDNTLNCFISDIIGNPSISKEDKSDIVIAYSSLRILNTCPTKDYKLMCNVLKGLYKVISKPSNNLKNRSCNEC